MDVLGLMQGGIERFGALVGGVRADRWEAPTPCAEWSVRDLVNHVTSEHLWAPHLLRGETLAQVGDRYDGDVLGSDPVAAWNRAAEASAEAWRGAKAGDQVHLSIGLSPLEEYAEQMYVDLVVHAWDLARGAGLEYAIDDASARHCSDYIGPHLAEWPGMFAAPVETDSASPSDRLIALVGRDPSWTRPA